MVIDRTSHCGGGDNSCPLGQTGQEGKQVGKKQIWPTVIFSWEKKQNSDLSLFRGLHLASATSFLLQNVAFLIWAPIQAHVQEQQVEFPFVAFGDSCQETHNVVVEIDINTPNAVALVFRTSLSDRKNETESLDTHIYITSSRLVLPCGKPWTAATHSLSFVVSWHWLAWSRISSWSFSFSSVPCNLT